MLHQHFHNRTRGPVFAPRSISRGWLRNASPSHRQPFRAQFIVPPWP